MIYTGLVNTAIGIGLGLVLAKIVETPYTSPVYRHLDRVYMVVGGAGGFYRRLQLGRAKAAESKARLGRESAAPPQIIVGFPSKPHGP